MNRRTFLAAASALFLPYEPERVYSFGSGVGRLPERAHGIESWFPDLAPVYFRTPDELFGPPKILTGCNLGVCERIMREIAAMEPVAMFRPEDFVFRSGDYGATLLSPRARGEELSRGADASQYAGEL